MDNYLEVTGTGAAAQTPDRLDLNLAVTALRPTVQAALTQVNEQVRALGAVARSNGLTDADIRTTSSSAYEEYSGPQNGPENTRAGYRANQDLTLRINDLGSLDAILAAIVEAVGDDFRMNGLSWGIADSGALQSRARSAAFEDARVKAGELAALAGRSLGDLLQLTETGQGFGGIPRFALAKADAAGFAPEQGASTVEVSLVTRWSLT